MSRTKTEKYVVEIKPNFTTAKGREVLKQLIDGETKIKGNVIISKDDNSTQYIAYLDEVDVTTKLGFVDSAVMDADGNAFPGQKIDEIINSDYKGVIGVSVSPTKFNVVLKVSSSAPEKTTKSKVDMSSDIVAAAKKAAKAGNVTQDEMDERIQVMKENGVSDEVLLAVLGQYKTYSEAAKRPSTVYVDPYWKKGKPGMLNAALMDAIVGNLMIFEGDKSVGKNVCAETVAWLLNKPVAVFTFGPDLTSDDIYGVKTTETPEINKYSMDEMIDLAKAALICEMGECHDLEVIQKAATYRALQAKAPAVSIKDEITAAVRCISEGWVFVANELNLGREDIVTQFINPLGDGTGHIIALGKKVPINEGFVFIGTQNVGDTYFGTKELNEAAASRIDRLIFEYHDSIFPQLKSSLTGYSVNDKILEAVDNMYQAAKRLSEDNPSTPSSAPISNKCLNVRGFVRAIKTWSMFQSSTTLKDKILTNVINNCDEEDRPQLITLLDKYIKW